ncbi:hypothetical protein BH10BAC5_BH10BAC5_15020 [soil metagenome]
MFESIVKEKASREVKKLEFYDVVDPSIISKSNLSPFVKNFIITEAPYVSTNEELEQQVNKAVKLLINYSIRPKWTIINFVFGSLDSKRVEEVSSKLSIFPFYKFYSEIIEEYIDRNDIDSISKSKAELLIDEMNVELKEKLTQNISGIKIKNFLINVFRLKYENESDLNLDSVIPFSFLRIFLNDKGYEDLVKKFDSLNCFKENDNISYKDIIKVLTDKFVPPSEPKNKEKPVEKQPVKQKIEIDLNVKTPDQIKVSENKESLKSVVSEKDRGTEKTETEKIIIDDVKPVKEKTYSRYDIYSNERDEDKKKALETEQQKDPVPQNEQLEVIDEVKHEKDLEDLSTISGLFTEGEKKEIQSRIYKSSKSEMRASFKELDKAKTWNDAVQILKKIILDNKVDIYHKKIVFFVDMLNEHFIKKEK